MRSLPRSNDKMLKSSPPDKIIKIAKKTPNRTDLNSLLDNIAHHPIPLPTYHNTVAFLAEQNEKPIKISEFANRAKPIIDIRFIKLAQDFLAYKSRYGSSIEKNLYEDMTLDTFISRLLLQRPFVFMGDEDFYLLQDGQNGKGHFDDIGTPAEAAPFTLENYLSYDEMQLAALITIATPSFFINKGDKQNVGKPGKPGSFEETGLIVATVGTRFERPGLNEYAHMLITRMQNTNENGYGKNGNDSKKDKLRYFAQYYHQGDYDDYFFPTFTEAKADEENRYALLPDGSYLNKAVYQRRIRSVIEPFLIAANEYGQKQDQQVFVEASRIGLGVWAIDPSTQAPLQLEVYAEILSEVHLPFISDINFGRFKNNSEIIWQNLLQKYNIQKPGHTIRIQHIERSPLEKLSDEHSQKCLVTNYAWDGNAYPGNEFWLGEDYFSASSDPAAACCTQIAELQNPLINPNISGANTAVSLQGRLLPIQWFDGLKCHGQYPLFLSETARSCTKTPQIRNK